MNRRDLILRGVAATAIAGAGRLLVREAQAGAAPGRYTAAFAPLDAFVEAYVREMNAPGMTLSLADADGSQRVCVYGFDDPSQHRPLQTEQLFHIGSISKSFTALCLLQMRDEGKLDLHKPIAAYLPWLRFDPATRPLTAHDLLTHAAALPDGPLFPADPAFRHRATAAPASFFHYCNMGYAALGHLLVALDGRPLAQVFRARLLTPLGMNASEPVITLDAAERIASSFWPVLNDRPYARHGRLLQAPPTAMVDASGCVASTARDMSAYLGLIINRGRIANGRLLSEAGFELFATPHIAAEEFGPGASYGYGIAVDTLDGHKRLRHTGGMLSFASALEVDLDAGVGAFASINAMQGYRPRPVAEYALRLMRACREGGKLPDPPAVESSARVANAAEYAGRYAAGQGDVLEIVAEGDRLFLLRDGARVALEPDADQADGFIVLHPELSRFALLFGRAGAEGKGAVVEAGWGDRWFATERYSGPREFPVPAEWRRYPGHYRNEDPWIGSHHVVLRKGRLWLNGSVPLQAGGDGRFWLRDEPHSPEWVKFTEVVNGVAQRMVLSGANLWRSA